jgi:MYXO-CTERM domain-containing protein
MHRSHSGARWLALILVGFAIFVIGACSSNAPSSGGNDDGPDASTPRAEPARVASAPSVSVVDDRSPNFIAPPADTSHAIVQRTPRVELAHAASSPALVDLPSADEDEEREESDHEVKRIPRTRPQILERSTVVDPVAQAQVPILSMPVALVNIPGQGNSTSPATQTGTPPDTNGAVGPNHFVQVVNGGIEVWDKSGTVLAASKLLNALWTTLPAGDPCHRNDGDPVVLYDQMADRWFVTQFALPNQNKNAGPSYQCIAVSKTPDPTGAYWLYEFSYPYAINDYGKFGVWPDAYYAAFHMFGTSAFRGDDFCAYDRAKMLTGAPATQQCFLQAYANPPPCPATQPFTVFGAQPVNMDGPIKPPVGTPGFYLQFDYSACNGPYTNLDLWKMHVDFTTPANSTVTGPTVLPVAGFTPTCDANGGNHCVPEPGNVTLDGLDDRMMFRLTYRNFGTHESLMINHSVVGGAGSGVRWYEVRAASAALPVVFQQGTYAPADTNWRWMGSLAQDQARGVALGFSLSSLTQDPSIGWTGRLATDALGTMPQGETVIATGTAVELDDYAPQRRGRWGDYSNMTVDPVDDCTFWYTTELFHTAGRTSWDTQIASVKFPSCAANDFSISIAPPTQNLSQGGTVPYTITTALTRGIAEPIVLNVQDLPTGVSGVFVPPSVTAGQTSTLTLTATNAAPLSTTTFTVIGTAPSAVHAATAQVVVVACAMLTCPVGQNCGTAPNGCGGTISCGNCTLPQTCGGGGVVNQCGCTPTTTCPVGDNCGTVPNGCGGMISCGPPCTAPQTCGGGGTPNQCGCTPATTCPAGDDCGAVPNGCGGTIDCGTCVAPQTCGGGGIANHCSCTPITTCPVGDNCGTISNGCGGTISCGPACSSPQTCGGGGTPNQCGCTPATTCPAGQDCGTAPNGCGGTISCGNCTAPQTCGGGGTQNHCGCTPATTCPAGDNCGTVPNGCGGTISCGPACTSPQTCGGGGTANHCGCTPSTTCPVGQNCGTAPNGCGGTITCGTCTSPQTCGGGGTTGSCGCTPISTCGGGQTCGTVPDTCGGLLSCGTCASNETCTGNRCVPNTVDAGSDSGTPDSGAVDSGAPDASVPDSSVPDSSVADSSVPDSSVPDSSVADSSVPDSSVPDSSVPDSSVADSSAADSSAADSSAADSSAADSSVVADSGSAGNDSGDDGGSVAGGGCGCRTVETRSTPASLPFGLGGLALLGALRWRRRRAR